MNSMLYGRWVKFLILFLLWVYLFTDTSANQFFTLAVIDHKIYDWKKYTQVKILFLPLDTVLIYLLLLNSNATIDNKTLGTSEQSLKRSIRYWHLRIFCFKFMKNKSLDDVLSTAVKCTFGNISNFLLIISYLTRMF